LTDYPYNAADEEHGDFLDDDASFSDDAGFQQYFSNRMAAIPQNVLSMATKFSHIQKNKRKQTKQTKHKTQNKTKQTKQTETKQNKTKQNIT
jgi:hypothetical protein